MIFVYTNYVIDVRGIQIDTLRAEVSLIFGLSSKIEGTSARRVTANKTRQTLSQPKPWCNDSGVLNLHHDYYTTIMTSRRLFRHNPVSHGTNQKSGICKVDESSLITSVIYLF